MCLTPLKIVNPTRRFVKGLSRVHLHVGCGHCKECLKRKEDDMFVRAFFEYKRCVESGGEVWFPTLTYNDDHLPMYHDEAHDFHCQIINVNYLKKFRDHFRMNLARFGYPIDNIRFEFVTEYGTDLGRLHHHVLIFMPYKVPQHIMVDSIERAWSYRLEPVKVPYTITKGPRKGEIIQKYLRTPDLKDANGKVIKRGRIVKMKVPKFGYTMWSKEWPKTLQNCKAIQYVQKYLHKPSEWLEKYHIPEYEQTLKDEVAFWEKYRSDSVCLGAVEREKVLKYLQDTGTFYKYKAKCEEYGLTYHKDKDDAIHYYYNDSLRPKLDGILIQARVDEAVAKLKEWRSHCRFHLQSTFFGYNGIDECYPDVDSLKDGRINLSDHGSDNFDLKCNFVYNMPMYYYRHIFQHKDEHGLYVKNDIYDEVTKARFSESQKRQVDSLQPYFQTPEGLAAHLPNISRESAFSIFDYIRKVMDGRSVDELVLYQTVYQGLCCPIDDHWIDYWRNHPVEYLIEQSHTEFRRPEPDPERYRDKGRAHCQDNDLEWGDLEWFEGFDSVLELIMDCEYNLGEQVDSAWRLKMKREAELAKFLPKKRVRMSNNKFFVYGKK